MKNYICTAVFFSILFLFSGTSEAKNNVIVVLQSSDAEPYADAVDGIVSSLNEERVIVYQLEKRPEKILRVMEKISVLSPKAVIGVGGLSVLAIKTHPLRNTPTIFIMTTNINHAMEIPGSVVVPMHVHPQDHYEQLKRFLPHRRIGIPYNPRRSQFLIDDLMKFFAGKPISLVPFIVNGPSDISETFSRIRPEIDAIWIIPDSSFIDSISIRYIIHYSERTRIPIIGYSESFTKLGGLLSLSASYRDMGVQGALLAQRMLLGEQIKRVQYSRKLNAYINIRVARILQLPIPPEQQLLAFIHRIYPTNPELRIK